MDYKSIFCIVFIFFWSFVLAGIFEVCDYTFGIRRLKLWKRILLVIPFSLVLLFVPPFVANCIAFLPKSDYWFVLFYIIVLGVLSINGIYLPPKTKINSVFVAFRLGFTQEASKFWIVRVSTSVFIQGLYLIILFLGQINDLGIIEFAENWKTFLELNKYGIVIIYAIQKLVNEITKTAEHRKLRRQNFIEYQNSQ